MEKHDFGFQVALGLRVTPPAPHEISRTSWQMYWKKLIIK